MSKSTKKETLETARAVVSPVEAIATDEGDAAELMDAPALEETTSPRASRRFKEVWLVEDRKNSRSLWTRVGTAFENSDGSWNIRLSAVPVGTGRLNVRDPLPRAEVSA